MLIGLPGEALLPARELLQLGDGLVDLRLGTTVKRRGGLGLVLVLLQIHLELE